MEDFIQYLGMAVIIVVLALVVVYLKKNGIFVRRVKHGKTEVEFETTGKDTDEQEKGYERNQPICKSDECGKNYRVFDIFLSSPGGLDEYREAFCKEVDFFSKNHAEGRKVIFRVTNSDDIPTGYGRPQSIINKKLVDCEGYVLLLHDRWGSSPGDSDGRSFSSGSEEEFKIAEEMLKKGKMDRIGVYFKSVALEKLQLPDEQLAKVEKFKKWIEHEHILFYNKFADEVEFRKKVQSFMAEWLDKIAPWQAPEGVKSVLDYAKF